MISITVNEVTNFLIQTVGFTQHLASETKRHFIIVPDAIPTESDAVHHLHWDQLYEIMMIKHKHRNLPVPQGVRVTNSQCWKRQTYAYRTPTAPIFTTAKYPGRHLRNNDEASDKEPIKAQQSTNACSMTIATHIGPNRHPSFP